MADVTPELRGYMTTSTSLAATRRKPCPDHFEPDWEGRGLWNPDCPECQATPPVSVDLGIVDWDTNDPHAIGITPDGVILEPNPFKRLFKRRTR